MIASPGIFTGQVEEVLQMIPELFDKILCGLDDLAVPIRFMGGEMVNLWHFLWHSRLWR